MEKNSVKKNIFYQVAYQLLTVITPLLTSPHVSRVLGAEQLGLFSSTYSYVVYFMLLGKLGIDVYGTRVIAKITNFDLIKRKFCEIYLIQLLFSIVSLFVYYSCISLFIHSEFEKSVAFLQGIWIIGTMLDVVWLFLALEKVKVTVLRNVVIKILSVLLVLTLVNSPDDLFLYVLILTVSTVFSNLLLWPFVMDIIKKGKVKKFTPLEHLRDIFILFIPILAISVYHVMDKTMLGIFSTASESGYYYSIDRLATIPFSIVLGINSVLLPRVTKLLNESPRQVLNFLLRTFELTWFIVIAISFGLLAIADIFVPIFFGEGFIEAVNLVYIFSPILIIRACGEFIANQYLFPTHQEIIYTHAVLVGAAVNIIISYPLIVNFGAMGASIGALISEIIVLLLIVLKIRGQLPLKQFIIKNLEYILSGVILFLSVRVFLSFNTAINLKNLTLSVLIGMVSYLIPVYFYGKYFKKNGIFSGNIYNLLKK